MGELYPYYYWTKDIGERLRGTLKRKYVLSFAIGKEIISLKRISCIQEALNLSKDAYRSTNFKIIPKIEEN